MAKGYRKGRLSEEIRKVISDMLLRDLTDPVLKNRMVSISEVEVTQDASHATVYVSILGKNIEGNAAQEEKDEVINALKKAKTLIKREINRKIKLHHIPELNFVVDNSMEYGRHMSMIIDSIEIPEDEEDVTEGSSTVNSIDGEIVDGETVDGETNN